MIPFTFSIIGTRNISIDFILCNVKIEYLFFANVLARLPLGTRKIYTRTCALMQCNYSAANQPRTPTTTTFFSLSVDRFSLAASLAQSAAP